MQCGYCTSGMIMSARSLVEKDLEAFASRDREAHGRQFAVVAPTRAIVKAIEIASGTAKEVRK